MVLDKVYRAFFYDERCGYDKLPSLKRLLTENVSLDARTEFRRTVCLVSDSIWRHIKSIEGGCIFYESGATFGELAGRLAEHFVTLTKYRFVIFSAGPNDSKKSPEEQIRSFDKLKRFMEPLRFHPQTQVLFNLGFDIPEFPKAASYNQWFQERFTHEMNADNFHIMDWSDPHINYGLVTPSRIENGHLFDKDRKHPNELGLKEIWRRIHRTVPRFRDLRLLQMKTTPQIWIHETLDQIPSGEILMSTPVKTVSKKTDQPGTSSAATHSDDDAGPSNKNYARPIGVPGRKRKKSKKTGATEGEK
jgi:hypothetical protein